MAIDDVTFDDQRIDDATFDDRTATDDRLADEAVAIAHALLSAALADESRSEHRRRARLGRLLADPFGRELVLSLTDEVLRIDDNGRAAQQFAAIVRRHRVDALGWLDRLMLRAGALVAPRLPSVVMPLVVRRIQAETRGIVLPANDPALGNHIARRGAAGFDLNINPLGEAILSDAEADARFDAVCRTIVRADVDYVSVKISSIVANLDAFAFEHSIDRVCHRLRTLYRAADSTSPATFVNLDMEEYRDLELTLVAFMRVLDEPEFATTDAGIVLQAYLPDVHDAAERLGNWAVARQRRVAGSDGVGGWVKVRVVKGANLAMELVDGEQHGWLAAPYGSKADVDASYKALLDSLLRPGWSAAITVGVASHNLFDVAWAIAIGRDRGVTERMDFEMLEGMAPAQSRAVRAITPSLRMYSPVVAADDFEASLAYLARRLDENTQPDNFLRALFTLTPDTPEFDAEADRFRTAVAARHDVARTRRRHPLAADPAEFANEPETDFTDPAARHAVAGAMADVGVPTPELVSSPDVVGNMVAAATAAAGGHSVDTRRSWLRAAAATMRAARFDTIAVMASETGKTAAEGDREIAEAVDFCEYYAEQAERLDVLATDGFDVRGRGAVAVIGPWNFPYAIPVGGVAAALAAGNGVILKPAPEAVGVGAMVAEHFWAAGVPRDVLQLLVCDDGPVGTALVTDPRVDTVVLTGSLATASMFHDWRPGLRLLAETSGKNALVITAAADLDDAIADLVASAFGHAGQKCSAASLAIVEASVYDSADFLLRLRDAVRSLRVGPASEPATMMGPVIAAPSGPLYRALTQLDAGESWLVEPKGLAADGADDLTGRLWSPGVRIGVVQGSWFHRTECFGPVLGVMRADDLDHAIAIQNDSDFGLTGGLHSLDEREIAQWVAQVEVGNAYVNRGITGAIVRRQPFGGWKQSSIGGGSKAGGPGYVLGLSSIIDPAVAVGTDGDARGDTIARATSNYERAWADVFAVEHDESGLRSESNLLRYQPLRSVLVRYDPNRILELELLRAAARLAGVALVESATGIESEDVFAGRVPGVDRVRLLAPMSNDARRACHGAGVAVDDAPPVTDGFVEMHRWVREQAISRSMHRHGRLLSSVAAMKLGR